MPRLRDEQEAGLGLNTASAATLMEEFHEEAGIRLAQAWSLPEWLCTVIECHHDFEQAGKLRIEAMVGSLSHELALWTQSSDHDDTDTSRIESLPVSASLEFAGEDLRAVMDEHKAIIAMAHDYV